MVGGIRIKVCGLTTLVDAETADASGADFLGFNFYPKSPRHVTLAQWQAMAPRLPPRKKVAIVVAPAADELRALVDAGFAAFQIHFPADTPSSAVGAWAKAVGPDKLWLAPKRAPGSAFPAELLLHGQTVLWDTYAADAYGGTGRIGDWNGFRAAREAHPNVTWILAGGLAPDNAAAALKATGARFLDVNSGIESSPGVKDPEKLRKFFAAVRAATEPGVGP